MEKPVVLEGICHYWQETGVEGGRWAFQDSKHIFPPTPEMPHGRWSYDGLWILKNGDFIVVLSKQNKKIVWSGFVSLWTDKNGRTRQRGVPREDWSKWFRKEYPAKLTPGPNQTKKPA